MSSAPRGWLQIGSFIVVLLGVAAALYYAFLGPAPAIAAVLQEPGSVAGAVQTGSGAPIQGVRVAVMPVPEPGESLSGTLTSIGETGADGRYHLSAIPPGAYYLITGAITRPLYHPGVNDPADATVVVVMAGVTSEISAITFTRTRVTGIVTDGQTGTGRTVERLALCCTRQSRALLLTYTPVGPDGTFEFQDILPGNYYIVADDPAIVPIAQPIRVDVADLTGVEVKVSSGTFLNGILVDANGGPVAGGVVRLRPATGAAALDITAGSESLGVEDFISSLFLLRRWPPASPGGRASIPEAVEYLLDRGPNILRYARIQTDGSFSFIGIPPGSYRLEGIACGITVEDIEIGPEGRNGLQIESKGIQFHGRVELDNGSPLPPLSSGWIRFFAPSEPAAGLTVVSDSDGRFSVCIPPGEYRVFAEYRGYRVQSMSDGSTDLLRHLLRFDGVSIPEILVIVGQ